MKVGYSRVSSLEQNLDRQKKSLTDFGCEYIVEEKVSGASRENRPVLKSLMETELRFKDVLVVTELSRLARSLQDLLSILNELKQKDVDFISIKENIDTRDNNIYSKFMLQIMGAIAEFERDLIKERQKEGISLAKKKREKYKGRQRKYHENASGTAKLQYDTIVGMLEKSESVMDIHSRTGVARNTIYKIKKEIKQSSPGEN